MRVDKLTSFEAETLIRFFLNHLRPELRGKLMVELPVVYRKLIGKEADDQFRAAVKNTVLDRPLAVPRPLLVAVSKALGEGGHITPRLWGKIGGPPGAPKSGLTEMLENLEEDE